MDKLLTFNGPTARLEVPGFFNIGRGESHPIDDHLLEAIERANPELDLTISDLPKGGKKHGTAGAAQPEAHEGEGQPTAPDPEEE